MVDYRAQKFTPIPFQQAESIRKVGCRLDTYLLVSKIRPKPGLSSLLRMRRQQTRLVIPHLINILNSNKRLTDWFPIVKENWDLLVNWVHLKKQRTLVPQVLFSILIIDTLLF
jgi:hypothetical protein